MGELLEAVPASAGLQPAWFLRVSGGFEVPDGIRTFEDFRRWTLSENFPETGRIDWIDGLIEVDMLAENVFEHGTPKGEFCRQVLNIVRHGLPGHMFTDPTRYVSGTSGLSCEPDLSFALAETVASGAVTFTPASNGRDNSYSEVVGPLDMVLEIVSDSSVSKDLRRLPGAYFAAGVVEYWTVDARGNRCDFRIHRRGESAYLRVEASEEGYQWSDTFGRAFRLERLSGPNGLPDFLLHLKPPLN